MQHPSSGIDEMRKNTIRHTDDLLAAPYVDRGDIADPRDVSVTVGNRSSADPYSVTSV